jgi:CubicO group peptidase (beta-lactamase class C family)
LDRLLPPLLAEDGIGAASVVVGEGERILYRRSFGSATADTVFDLASCTKGVGTTTAVMKLVEEGRLSLEDPIGRHLPSFAARPITVADLLRHCSGLPPYLVPKGRGPDAVLGEIAALKPGKPFAYSCLNMISLGRLVERRTGRRLSEHLQEAFWGPLGMKDTGYDPDPARCAPTAKDVPPGTVHDPLARAYRSPEGDPGNAGLFSTADDLARFCRELLAGRILKPATLSRMFESDANTRGLGWDVFDDPPYRGGVGHTGFTGTLIWMDPARGRYLVLLTNRTLRGEDVSVARLRREVLAVVNR